VGAGWPVVGGVAWRGVGGRLDGGHAGRGEGRRDAGQREGAPALGGGKGARPRSPPPVPFTPPSQVAALLDKKARRRVPLEAEYTGFEVGRSHVTAHRSAGGRTAACGAPEGARGACAAARVRDRPARVIQHRHALPPPSQCPDEFIVGYGIDYAEKYRCAWRAAGRAAPKQRRRSRGRPWAARAACQHHDVPAQPQPCHCEPSASSVNPHPTDAGTCRTSAS
jgi:hypothetical protein